MTPPMDEPLTDDHLEKLIGLIAETGPRDVHRGLIELRESRRTRSVEPPREMIERAKAWLDKWIKPGAHRSLRPESLAALLASVRSQAIEMCAGVADKANQERVAASIRSLR